MFGQGGSGSGFGSTNPSFGSTTSSSSAGTGSSVFSGAPSGGQQGVFGSNQQSAFGTGSGGPASGGSNIFGSGSPQNVFGSNPNFGNTTTNVFGSGGQTGSGFGSGGMMTSTGTGFGSSGLSTGFAATSVPPAYGSSSIISSRASMPFSSSTTASSGFGSLSSGTPAFGQAPNLSGSSSVFGSTGFSSNTTTTASLFGSVNTTSSAFGEKPPTFGGPSTSAFGSGESSASALFKVPVTTGSGFGAVNTTATGIFAGTAPSAFTSVTTNLFSATPSAFTGSNFAASTSSSGSFTVTGPTSKPSVFGSSFQTSSVSSSSVFGGPPTTAGNVFQQALSTAVSTASSGVFGPKSTSTASTGAGTFSNLATASVFSKDSSSKDSSPVQNIFRSIVKDTYAGDQTATENKEKALFGKTATRPRRSSAGNETRQTRSPSPGTSATETVADKSSERTAETDSRKRSLFGSAGMKSDRTETQDPKSRLGEGHEKQEASEEEVTKPRLLRRKSSLEEIRQKVAIVCKNVPAHLNTKTYLTGHFKRFGTIKRLYSTPNTESAVVHFDTHEAAEKALKQGRNLQKGVPPIQIFWSSHTPKTAKSREKRSAQSDTQRSEVDDELASMGGTSDIRQQKFTFVDRPEDPTTEKPNKKAQPPKMLSQWRKEKGPVGKTGKFSKETATARQSKSETSAVGHGSSSQPLKGASHISLKSLNNAVAHSTSEKCEILDNRDKIIRMGMGPSQSDLTSSAIKGTCQDMCPELERYIREDRRRLASYEIMPGSYQPGQNPQVDHARTVKEYSRSSADQEMPLPHELRPPHVLNMTMDYLMHMVMDTVTDGKWGDWFEFLWSRTRSLRKDITQQQLCDLTSVDIIEKHVRFHIYCAEMLCEEDAFVFDQKINTENLSKCLQTLKEMYYDLEKKGVQCPREEEFRAYIVLMNLNEGDTLREVQELKQQLRESPAVRFATNVHSALSNNNYIKFFKLARQAPFMYACLMHRYFNQVRALALITMMKAYRSVPYPLSDLVRCLGFESMSEAVMFCQHHGLSVQDDKVLLEKSSFIQPETALSPTRAVNLIESKLTTSVGEAVNGRPLSPFTLHQPVSSFDESGRFIGGDVQISQPDEPDGSEVIQALSDHDVVPPSESNVNEPPPYTQIEATSVQDTEVPSGDTEDKSTAAIYSNEAIKEVARELFLVVINEYCHNISQGLVKGIHFYLSSDSWIYEDLEKDATNQMIRLLCQETLDECAQEKMEQEARARAELSAMRARATSLLSDAIISQVVIKQCNDIAEQQYQEVCSQLLSERIKRVTESISQELLDMAVQEETCLVAEDIFETDVVERLQVLRECTKATHLLVQARFFKRWKNKNAARQRLKRSMETFPPTPSLSTLSEQVEALIPDSRGISQNALHLGMSAHATLDCASRVMEKQLKLRYNMTLYNYWKEVRKEKAWSPFVLGTVFYKKLMHRFKSFNRKISGGSLYWKLVLSLPDVGPNSSCDDDYTQQTIISCDWLRSKFRKGTVPNSELNSVTEVLSLYTTPISLPPGSHGSLGVCVRVVKGFPEEDDPDNIVDKQHILGTSAILFYVGEVGPENSEFYLGEVQARLLHLLETLPKSSPVPLVMVRSPDSPVTEDSLDLSVYVDEGMLSDWMIVTLPLNVEEPNASKQVYDSIVWSTCHCPPLPGVVTDTLRDFTESALTQMYFTSVYQSLSNRRKKGLLHQPCELLISYYNDVIRHLAAVASDASLQELSWPVAEFSTEADNLASPDWNTEDQLSLLQDSLLSLQLPECYLEETATDWETAVEDVWAFVASVVEEDENKIQLFSKIKWLVRKCERQFRETCLTSLRLDDCRPESINMPWTDIIHACIEHKLAHNTWHGPSSEDDVGELMVYYMKRKLESYKPPTEWLDATLETNERGAPVLQETVLHSAKRKLETSLTQERDTSPKALRLDQNIHLDLSVTSHSRLEADSIAQRLNNLLATEKRQNAKFQDFLEKSVLGNELNDTTFHQAFGSPVFALAERQSLVPVSLASQTNKSEGTLRRTHPAEAWQHHSVSEDMDKLNLSLQSQKKADLLYEMRLQSFLTDT